MIRHNRLRVSVKLARTAFVIALISVIIGVLGVATAASASEVMYVAYTSSNPSNEVYGAGDGGAALRHTYILIAIMATSAAVVIYRILAASKTSRRL